MRIHWLQHVPFEGLGSIEPWVVNKGYSLECTRLYAGEKPPCPDDYDWLIVMGGPMNIYQEAEYRWLIEEKLCIKRAIKSGKKVLGICLGAQLIADALQARVFSTERREIGWFKVNLLKYADIYHVFSEFSLNFPAFHWHGDAFGIPEGAQRVAESDACANQAFVYGKSVVALQFHLETTAESAAALIKNCGEDLLQDGDYVQTPEQILSESSRFDELNNLMSQLLDNMDAVKI